ncbi:MAG: hypothetical protein PHP05_06190 [Sideroxydans sp.]|nr:hypothetical protein [Sideroxydans sp.]
MKQLQSLMLEARALSKQLGTTVAARRVSTAATTGTNVLIDPRWLMTDRPEYAPILRAFLDHEVLGHNLHTDFSAGNLRQGSSQVRRLAYAVLEDLRIEVAASKVYPGVGMNLSNGVQAMCQHTTIFGPEHPTPMDMVDPAQVLSSFLLTNGRSLISPGQERALRTRATAWKAAAEQMFGNDAVKRCLGLCKQALTAPNTLAAWDLAGELEKIFKDLSKPSKPKPSNEQDEGEGEDADDSGSTSGKSRKGKGKGKSKSKAKDKSESKPESPESPENQQGEEGEDGQGEDAGSDPDNADLPNGSDASNSQDGKEDSDASGDSSGQAGPGGADQSSESASDADSGESGQESSAGSGQGQGQGSAQDKSEVSDGPSEEERAAAKDLLRGSSKEHKTDLGDLIKQVLGNEQAALERRVDQMSVHMSIRENPPRFGEIVHEEGLTHITRNRIGRDLDEIISSFGKRWTERAYTGRRIDSRVLSGIATGNMRIFKRKHEEEAVDTAVYLLVDGSSSMMMPIASNSAQRVTRRHAANSVVCALGDILNAADVPFGVSMFATAYCQVKSFETEWRVARKQMGDTWGSGTVLMPSIVRALAEICNRPEQRKLFLLVTDGAVSGEESDLVINDLKKASKDYGVETATIMVTNSTESPFVNALRNRGLRAEIIGQAETLGQYVMDAVKHAIVD